MAAAGGPPPGWYPDPWGQAPARWWDGTGWTGHVPPAPAGVQAPVAGPVPPSAGLTRWAQVGAVAYLAVQLVTYLVYAATIRSFVDDIRTYEQQVRDDAGTGQVPLLHLPTSLTALTPLSLLATGALVVVLVWQHRAAVAARSAGWPAAHGPGFGVGAWFIPVVQLWMPYQAQRDLLPPGDPARRRLLGGWLAGLGGLLLGGASVVVAATGAASAATVLVAVTVVLLGWSGFVAWRHIAAVRAALAAQPSQGGWQTSQA